MLEEQTVGSAPVDQEDAGARGPVPPPPVNDSFEPQVPDVHRHGAGVALAALLGLIAVPCVLWLCGVLPLIPLIVLSALGVTAMIASVAWARGNDPVSRLAKWAEALSNEKTCGKKKPG